MCIRDSSSDVQKRQFLDNGVFEIKPNWASSTVDPRSDARKNQELIEDILYNRIQGDVSSYSVAGWSLSKLTPEELIRQGLLDKLWWKYGTREYVRIRELVQTF